MGSGTYVTPRGTRYAVRAWFAGSSVAHRRRQRQILLVNSPLRSAARALRGTLALLVALSATLPRTVRAGEAPPVAAPEVRSLFDGRSLGPWRASAFDSQTEVRVERSFRGEGPAIVVPRSSYMAGINLDPATPLPRMNYEVTLEAMKLEGGDFFCGLTFPVAASACTLIVGGWGGSVTGISCIDNSDASDNETTTGRTYETGRWYRIRVRVTPAKLEAWIDDEQVVDFETAGRKLDLRFGDIKHSLPLGLAAYETGAAYRNLHLRPLPAGTAD